MEKRKPPKVGDKFAVISRGLGSARDRIDGAYFVTSVRGGLVSLGKENKPDPKARRNWRVWDSEGKLHTTLQWSHDYAEPWEERHLVLLRRQHALAVIEGRFEAHKREGFENLTGDDLQKLLGVLNEGERTT